MATTVNYTFELPTVGGDTSTWGTKLNANWTSIDALLFGMLPLDGSKAMTANFDMGANKIVSLADGTAATDGVAFGQLANLVTGPAAAADSNFASFDTLTGKLIKDSGMSAADFATAPQGALAVTALQPAAIDDAADLGGGSPSTTKAPSQAAVQGYVQGYVGANDTVKAWVNFNGIGTVAIRGSRNVSSITDNGTGDYTVNFTTAMGSVNYACLVTPGDDTGAGSIFTYTRAPSNQAPTVNNVRLSLWSNGGAAVDRKNVNVAILEG